MKNFFSSFCSSFFFSARLTAQNNKLSEQDSLMSIRLQEKGVAAGRLGDFEEAITTFNQLLKLREKNYGFNSPRLASPLNNLGITYKNTQNFDMSIEVYKRAEKLFIDAYGANYTLLGVIYINLGNIYRETGDYNQALEYQRNAYRILKKDSVKFNANFQDSKYNIAETQLKLGYNFEAIRFAQSNLKTISPQLKPLLFDLIASAYKAEGKYELSERNYLNAVDGWVKLYGDNSAGLISEYLAYSSFLMSQKEYEKAFLYSTKAKSIVLKFYGEKSTTYAEVQSNFGDYYYLKNSEAGQIDDFRTQRKKYLNEAIQYYQNSIVSLVDSFQIKDPFVEPPLKNVISDIQLVEVFKKKALSMEKLGDIFLSEFDYKNSIKYYNTSLSSLTNAIELIHRLQIGFENEESKFFLSQNQESTFSEAINICYKLYSQTKKTEYIERAFEFSERSKSSNLLASVKDVKAKEFGGIPDSLMKKENILKGNIANYNSMLFEENHSEIPDSQKVNLYSSKIFKYNEEYNRLIDSFEKLFPQYYALKYENKVVGIKEIQSKINNRQSLLEYYIQEPESAVDKGEMYCFLITKDSASFSKETIDYSFANNIQSIHDFLINPNYLYTKKKDFVDYSVAAYGLYEKLIKPVAKKTKRYVSNDYST